MGDTASDAWYRFERFIIGLVVVNEKWPPLGDTYSKATRLGQYSALIGWAIIQQTPSSESDSV